MEEVIVGVIAKRKMNEIRCQLNYYKEKWSFAIRTWVLPYAGPDDQDFIPTKKGVNIPLDALQDLHKAVGDAIKIAKKEKLL